MKIRIGISTCPNDTYTFGALLRGELDTGGLDLQFRLLDIDELNRALFAGELDVGKASFHAALHLADRTTILPVGAALGFGAGPLLLGARPRRSPAGMTPGGGRRRSLWLAPGQFTTASLLLELFWGDVIRSEGRLEQMRFSRIMPELEAGRADFGTCIHEGRFVWRERGLHLVEDLGTRWETETGQPLPLGGILARRDLDDDVRRRITSLIRDSLRAARQHPARSLATMRQWAQELDDDVIWKHVELYVNDWTEDLGLPGRQALSTLWSRAVASGLVAENPAPLEVRD